MYTARRRGGRIGLWPRLLRAIAEWLLELVEDAGPHSSEREAPPRNSARVQGSGVARRSLAPQNAVQL